MTPKEAKSYIDSIKAHLSQRVEAYGLLKEKALALIGTTIELTHKYKELSHIPEVASKIEMYQSSIEERSRDCSIYCARAKKIEAGLAEITRRWFELDKALESATSCKTFISTQFRKMRVLERKWGKMRSDFMMDFKDAQDKWFRLDKQIISIVAPYIKEETD